MWLKPIGSGIPKISIKELNVVDGGSYREYYAEMQVFQAMFLTRQSFRTQVIENKQLLGAAFYLAGLAAEFWEKPLKEIQENLESRC